MKVVASKAKDLSIGFQPANRPMKLLTSIFTLVISALFLTAAQPLHQLIDRHIATTWEKQKIIPAQPADPPLASGIPRPTIAEAIWVFASCSNDLRKYFGINRATRTRD